MTNKEFGGARAAKIGSKDVGAIYFVSALNVKPLHESIQHVYNPIYYLTNKYFESRFTKSFSESSQTSNQPDLRFIKMTESGTLVSTFDNFVYLINTKFPS